MKWLAFLLAGLLALLQYVLWFGDGGVRDLLQLQGQVEAQRDENRRSGERNDALAAEVADLKSGLDVVEARARLELGMIREGEVFIQVIETPPPPARPAGGDGR